LIRSCYIRSVKLYDVTLISNKSGIPPMSTVKVYFFVSFLQVVSRIWATTMFKTAWHKWWTNIWVLFQALGLGFGPNNHLFRTKSFKHLSILDKALKT